jgi:hypothetical protein
VEGGILELVKTKMDKNSVKDSIDTTKAKKAPFGKALLLAGGLGLAAAGCTDKIMNNYYGSDGGDTVNNTTNNNTNNTTNNYGSDGGVQDTDTQDTGAECDAGPELTCEEPKTTKYLSVGEKADVGELHFQVEDVAEEEMVVIRVLGPDCSETFELESLYAGESVELDLGIFGKVILSVDGVYAPDAGTDGAIVSVEKVCESDLVECEGEVEGVYNAILNQGESMSLGLTGIQWRHDDISVYPSDEPPKAIESVLQGTDVVAVAAIPEGNTVQIEVSTYRLTTTVNAVAPGYTFAVKWADLTISLCNTEAK